MSKLKLNDKNPSIKRILRELKDLNENPSSQFCVEALEENLFDLHFTILGPSGTEFETGRYHGRIVLPNEYPFKPPNIMLLTPNGRFQLFTKICLSITGYHPEFWQPAWGIRTVLVALISFLNEKAEGAIGGIDTSKEERQRLAKLSLNWKCDTCGAKLNELDLKYTDNKTEADSKEEELVKLFSFAPEKGKNESKADSNGSGNKNDEPNSVKNADNTINTEDIKASSENNKDRDGSNEVNSSLSKEINKNDTATTATVSAETLSTPSSQNSNTLPEPKSLPSTSSPSATNINQNTNSQAQTQVQQTQPSTKIIDTLIILAVAILLYYVKNSFI